MAKIVPAIKENSFNALMESSGLTCQEISDKYNIPKRTLYRWNNGQGVSSQAHNLIIKNLKEMVKATNTLSPVSENDFTFIDLFAGIGGFRRAFDSIGGKCVFTSEWDKASRMTYQANYTCDHPFAGDIREYTKDKESLDKIPRHDVLLAGFPCQPFSIAGVSKKNSLGRAHGFKCDTQGTLFFDLAQIIEHHKPPVIVLENVKNLTSHDGGKTFSVIKRTLEEELGYTISCRILDGRSWVPQHRERIFIVGVRKDLEITLDLKKLILPVENAPKLSSILHKKTEDDEFPFLEKGKVSSKYTLSQKLWDYLKQYKDKHAAKGNGFGYSLFGPNDVARTLSARYYKDGSEILINQGKKNPRRLTPRECSRLMGFDGPLDSSFKIVVSDTQAYRQFGNSVIVPCVTAVANFIKPYINSAVDKNNVQFQLTFEPDNKSRKTA